MGSTVIVLLIVFCYLAIVMVMGIRAGLNKDKSVEEFVTAGRSLTTFTMYFLMGGAIFSAFAFLGGPGWAYSKGAASFYILGYCAMGLIPWLLWGPKAYRMGRRYNYVTQAELVADRFQSKGLSAIMAIISILAFIQYIALQLKGMAYVLNVTTDGLIPFWLGALVAYGVVLVYVFTSGVRGVAWTNVLQGLMMLVMAWILGIWLPIKFHGGVSDMFTKIAASNPEHLIIGAKMSWPAFSSALIVSILGFTMWPHLFMKSFTVKSERTLKRTVALYPTFAIFMVPVLFIGFSGIGIVANGTLESADQILPYMLTQLNLPAIVLGLVAAATLAAAMSSSDTITHGAASVYTFDFHKKIINPNMDDRKSLIVTRVAIVVFCSIAYYIAVFGAKSLVSLLLGAYGAIVQFLPIMIAVFFWPRATKQGAILGLLTGVGINFYIVITGVSFYDIHAGVWGLLGNVIVLILASLLTKPQDKEHVNKFIEESQIPVD
ncbi:sodium:solute symporter family protein [Sporosalibacterium faouarense]|uniref:sodium:solute symporter family protein n=1 Tax=Sporosalibacterium faouarense TaxID=516123 RepID=UPI00192A6ED9|nr:sodium:solute symporter family protein [Sporosalibacterium faouarense]